MGCGNSKSTVTENRESSQNSEPKSSDKDHKETPAKSSEPPPEPASSTEKVEFNEEEVAALELHNECRKRHGCQPMTLNAELCRMAQEYAQKLIDENNFAHSAGPDRALNGASVGENLYCSSGMSPPHGTKATQSWYDEISDMDWSDPKFTMETGHFTQVVWKGSTELGIGIASQGSKVVVVGRYLPAGNMMGAFVDNVPPLL